MEKIKQEGHGDRYQPEGELVRPDEESKSILARNMREVVRGTLQGSALLAMPHSPQHAVSPVPSQKSAP